MRRPNHAATATCLLLTAALCCGTAHAARVTRGDLRLGLDDYGAVGTAFTSDNTRLLGADAIGGGTTNVSLLYAGFLYLPERGQYIGSAPTLEGRSRITSSAATASFSGSTFVGVYTITVDGVALNVTVTTTPDGNGGIDQSYEFENTNDSNVSFELAYALDMDIGNTTDDDDGSASGGFARGWDVDFGNPGAPEAASSFADPLLVARVFNATQVGLGGDGTTGILDALDGPAALATSDQASSDVAFGFRLGRIDLLGGTSARVDLQFLGGGRLPEPPVGVPAPGAGALLGLGVALALLRRRVMTGKG